MKLITIGQLARKAGVPVETIRYYERRGLMPRPPRRESGYRQYSEEAVDRIAFIRRAKGLGFSLNEILELLSLRVDPGRSRDVRRRAEAKLADTEEKIRTLRRMRGALRKLVEGCPGPASAAPCPILETLGGRPPVAPKGRNPDRYVP